MASLRQLHVGATLFAADHNNALPYTTQSQESGGYTFWNYRVADYVLQRPGGTIACPDSGQARGKQILPHRVPQGIYGVNIDLHCILNESTGAVINDSSLGLGRPPRFSDFPSPTRTVLYFDSGSYALRRGAATQPSPPWGFIPGYRKNANVASFYGPNPRVTVDAHRGRHGGWIQFVHMDGSIGRAKPDEFLDTATYWNLHRNQ